LSYRFVSDERGDAPGQITFEESLFNQQAHRFRQAHGHWKSFYILHHDDVVASCHWNIDGQLAGSPQRAPYGFLEGRNDLPPSQLFDFLLFMVKALRAAGVQQLQFKMSPASYQENLNSLLLVFLQNAGAVISTAEVSAIIEIKHTLSQRMHPWARRKWRQAKDAGVVVMRGDSSEGVYDFIAACRQAKGYQLSMTKAAFLEDVSLFPDRYLFFQAEAEGVMAAACIVVRARSDVWYTYAYDHASSFDSLSPVVLLMDFIHAHAKQEGVRIIDLGTSAIDNKPNFGLLDFKLHLGAVPAPKFSFQWKLH